MSIRIALIDDIECGEKELAAAWAKFVPEAIPAGLGLDHLFAWWERFGKVENPRIGFNKRPTILLIYIEEKLAGILPLMKVDRFKKKVMRVTSLEFFTQAFAGDYLDMIQDNMSVEQVEYVFHLVRKRLRYDLINLCYLKENSLLLQAKLGTTGFHAGKVIIPLTMSYEKIRSEVYSKNLRHVLNKFERRIGEAKKNIRSQVIEDSKDIQKIKSSIKEVSLSKLNDPGMHSAYQDPNLGELYFNSITNHEKPFCSIYLDDGKLLSYNMGYIKNDVICAVDAAYNREYAESQKIGLGILAYDRLVEKYAGSHRELDMGFGLDDYKFRFSKRVVFSYSLLIKGNTLKSVMLYHPLVHQQRENDRAIREKVKKIAYDK